MRILLLTHYYPAHGGGVEIVAAHVANILARERGLSVTWLAADVDPPPTDSPIRARPLAAWNPLERTFGLPYPLLKPSAMLALWQEVRGCDVIHVHECQYTHALLGSLFGRLQGKRLVVTQHVGEIEYRSRLKRLALSALNRVGARVVLDRASAVLFVSAQVMTFFRARTQKPALGTLVQNGVDTDRFRPTDAEARQRARSALGLANDTPLVAFAGRFVEKKGLRLVQAIAQARPEVSFVLAGRGPIDPAKWGLSNVQVAGVLDADRLAALFDAADLLCLPSFGEGFPLVVQEAMACGCPPLIDRTVAAGGQLPDDLGFYFNVLAEDAIERALGLLDRCLLEGDLERRERRQRNANFARAQWSWDRCARAHWLALKPNTEAAQPAA